MMGGGGGGGGMGKFGEIFAPNTMKGMEPGGMKGMMGGMQGFKKDFGGIGYQQMPAMPVMQAAPVSAGRYQRMFPGLLG